MKRLVYPLVVIALFAACVPSTETPASAVTAMPSATSTVVPSPTPTATLVPTSTATPVPTLTELPTVTPIPTATIAPMAVVPVSAGPRTLTEFNAGTDMKRLNVIGTGTPHDIEFSPDGEFFAVATERGVYLYDGITFEQKRLLDMNEPVDAIAFRPEGDVLAVAVNGKVSLWSVLSGQKILQFEGGMDPVSSLAYGLGGHVAAVNSSRMMLWDARTGHPIYEDNTENDYGTRAVTFTADGKQLVFGGSRGITTIEADTGKLVGFYRGSKDAGLPYDLIFNNDESGYILSSYFFNKVTLTADIATQKETTLSHCGLDLTRAREIAACSSQKSIVLIDGMNGQEIKSIDLDIEPNTNPRFLFALSPDGRFLTYWGKYGVYVLETETGSKIKTLDFTDFTLAQAGMIDIDGSRKYVAAVISSFGSVAIYDLATGDVLRTLKSDCCTILNFAFAPDQKTAATVDDGQNLLLWDLQSGKIVYKVVLSDYEDGPIVFSPDGTSLFFIKESLGQVSEFIFATGKTLGYRTDNYGYIRADSYTNDNLHFNRLGDLVMLGFQNGNPSFEDVKTGNKIVIPFEANTDPDIDLRFAFSHDGRFLSTGVLGKILVWDLETYKVVSTLVGHETRGGDGWEGTIKSLIGSPQSNLLVSVGYDGTTRLWNIASGIELRRLNVCCSTSFTPDGRYLITAGDGVIRVWGIP